MKKFDTILWRINGIILLVVVFAILIQICISIYESNDRASMHSIKGTADLIVTNEITLKNELFELSTPERVGMLNEHFIFSLSEIDPVSSSPIVYRPSYSIMPIANYLFFSPNNRQERWLFESNSQRIVSLKRILNDSLEYSLTPSTHQGPENDSVELILYTVVKNDLDNYSGSNSNDKISIYSSNSDGTELQELITNIDNRPSLYQYSSDSTMATYNSNGKNYVAIIKNCDGSVLSITELEL